MKAPEILRGAQDDKPQDVILSAAKDLWRTSGESPDLTVIWQHRTLRNIQSDGQRCLYTFNYYFTGGIYGHGQKKYGSPYPIKNHRAARLPPIYFQRVFIDAR